MKKIKYNGRGIHLFIGWFAWSLLILVTFGLALPFAINHLIGYICDNIEVK